MSKKRARYSAQFKFQLALEAAKGLKTINELASEHGVHPTQISEWKRQLLDAGDPLFNRHGARQHREQREQTPESRGQPGVERSRAAGTNGPAAGTGAGKAPGAGPR